MIRTNRNQAKMQGYLNLLHTSHFAILNYSQEPEMLTHYFCSIAGSSFYYYVWFQICLFHNDEKKLNKPTGKWFVKQSSLIIKEESWKFSNLFRSRNIFFLFFNLKALLRFQLWLYKSIITIFFLSKIASSFLSSLSWHNNTFSFRFHLKLTIFVTITK